MKMRLPAATMGRADPRGRGRFWLGAISPRTNLARPRPDARRTPPCRPRPGGEHAEQTAQCLGVAPGAAAPPNREAPAMDVLIARCAGLDVHKKTVVACLRCVGTDGVAVEE